MKNPAVFFSPLEAFVDKQVREEVLNGLPLYLFGQEQIDSPKKERKAREAKEKDLLKAVPCYLHRLQKENVQSDTTTSDLERAADEACKNLPSKEDILLLETIRRMSLNTVRIVVDGVMSVETTTLPAKIVSITFDKDTDWMDATSLKKGTIAGAYLTGGVPKIQNAADLKIDVTAISDGSDDHNVHFSLKITNPIISQTTLKFIVEKTAKDGTVTSSIPSDCTIRPKAQQPAPNPGAKETSSNPQSASTTKEGKSGTGQLSKVQKVEQKAIARQVALTTVSYLDAKPPLDGKVKE